MYLNQLSRAVRRSPITALVGPRQCGKTTLARMFAKGRTFAFFDLESQLDLNRLQNPQLMLGSLRGLVIIDEIQAMPELFRVLRVLVGVSTSTPPGLAPTGARATPVAAVALGGAPWPMNTAASSVSVALT